MLTKLLYTHWQIKCTKIKPCKILELAKTKVANFQRSIKISVRYTLMEITHERQLNYKQYETMKENKYKDNTSYSYAKYIFL